MSEEKIKQKFHAGDLVQITDKMPSYMAHFPKGKKAIVQYSYFDTYGGEQCHKQQYSVCFEDGNTCSWFEENQLTLIASGQISLLEEWRERL